MITQAYISQHTGIPVDQLPWKPDRPFSYPDYDKEHYAFWLGVWDDLEANYPQWIPKSLLAGFFEAGEVESNFNLITDIYSALQYDLKNKKGSKRAAR